ncbi:transposase [Paraburkholderia youngii]
MSEAIREQGYAGSYGRVSAFVRRWRERQAEAPRKKAYVPHAFEPGEAFQFDWSCEYAFIGGLRRRLEVAHVKLNASHAFRLIAYPTQSHEMLFDAHARAFAAFGGVPRRGIYDNMKTAVDTHHCHIVETGNESWRFRTSSAKAKTTRKKFSKTTDGEELSTSE